MSSVRLLGYPNDAVQHRILRRHFNTTLLSMQLSRNVDKSLGQNTSYQIIVCYVLVKPNAVFRIGAVEKTSLPTGGPTGRPKRWRNQCLANSEIKISGYQAKEAMLRIRMMLLL